MVADGTGGLLRPRQYPRSLKAGLPVIDDLLEFAAQNPEITQALSTAEILLGAWLIVR